MQAGQTATCEEITIGSLPVDNAACCSSQAHALPKHQDPAPVRKSETYMSDNCSIVPSAPPITAKKNPSGGLVQHGIGHNCPMLCRTSLSNMGSDNSVRCHVEQTWFNGFVRHGIGRLCPIPCQTTGFDEFVRHGIKQVVHPMSDDICPMSFYSLDRLFDSFESVAEQASDLLGELFSQQGNDLLVKELGKQANNLLAKR
ncbi:hypothetical protein PCANC_06790 [Puccinia coronata f. sp. avenae]|uniref:Uncharacterized protein n=1 Tax=Puccinia coronata f. sp. avenae TaxID=200324 RepID=A0A2N5UGV2_9BASI|nr:hypothetical protein PCANC_07998 [Puccinia coronata f. sp. avenae]PLW36985.1 hypothetical protein PCASD_06649 [Puccinia coronata f. sp. avenae]PLW41254.1 hypothetical protein PCANC_06790 [Puccinia coronata f. sp. avenae]